MLLAPVHIEDGDLDKVRIKNSNFKGYQFSKSGDLSPLNLERLHNRAQPTKVVEQLNCLVIFIKKSKSSMVCLATNGVCTHEK